MYGLSATPGISDKRFVTGALDGYVVKLYNIDTYPDVLLDSTVIKDEKFQLEGTRTFEYPKYCRLVVDMTSREPNQQQKDIKGLFVFCG